MDALNSSTPNKIMERARASGRGSVFTPALNDVAWALVRETGSKVQIAGARAANLLALTAQVPTQRVYLTEGPYRRVVLGERVVDLRHASPKHLILPGSAASTIVQALRHLGPDRADDFIRITARSLSATDKKRLTASTRRAPAWMQPTLLAITTVGSSEDCNTLLGRKRDLLR